MWRLFPLAIFDCCLREVFSKPVRKKPKGIAMDPSYMTASKIYTYLAYHHVLSLIQLPGSKSFVEWHNFCLCILLWIYTGLSECNTY